MAIQTSITAVFVFVLALSSIVEPFVSLQTVKGKLSCLDCDKDFDFLGIKILMKCEGERKPATTVTTAAADGGFQAEVPGGGKPLGNCLATILGGPEQLYAQRHNMISQIVKSANEPKTLTTTKPLTFSLSYPRSAGRKTDAGNLIGSSKTVDVPGTGGFGFPPASAFFPFLPIIGIP